MVVILALASSGGEKKISFFLQNDVTSRRRRFSRLYKLFLLNIEFIYYTEHIFQNSPNLTFSYRNKFERIYDRNGQKIFGWLTWFLCMKTHLVPVSIFADSFVTLRGVDRPLVVSVRARMCALRLT